MTQPFYNARRNTGSIPFPTPHDGPNFPVPRYPGVGDISDSPPDSSPLAIPTPQIPMLNVHSTGSSSSDYGSAYGVQSPPYDSESYPPPNPPNRMPSPTYTLAPSAPATAPYNFSSTSTFAEGTTPRGSRPPSGLQIPGYRSYSRTTSFDQRSGSLPFPEPDVHLLASESGLYPSHPSITVLQGALAGVKLSGEDSPVDGETSWRRTLANLQKYRIERDRIELCGEYPNRNGGFASVEKAYLLRDDGERCLVAVKKLELPKGSNPDHRSTRNRLCKRLAREADVWAAMKAHENILSFWGWYLCTSEDTSASDEAWLLSPWLPNGTLEDYLRPHTVAGTQGYQPSAQRDHSLKKRVSLAIDVAKGLSYLHSLSIVHGDIKSSNVLLNQDEKGVLCDMGLAREVFEVKKKTHLTTVGSPPSTYCYNAPELVLTPREKTNETDIWAFGCLLLELLSSNLPWTGVMGSELDIGPIYSALTIKSSLPCDLKALQAPECLKKILESCWKWERNERPSMADVLKKLQTALFEISIPPNRPNRPNRPGY